MKPACAHSTLSFGVRSEGIVGNPLTNKTTPVAMRLHCAVAWSSAREDVGIERHVEAVGPADATRAAGDEAVELGASAGVAGYLRVPQRQDAVAAAWTAAVICHPSTDPKDAVHVALGRSAFALRGDVRGCECAPEHTGAGTGARYR